MSIKLYLSTALLLLSWPHADVVTAVTTSRVGYDEMPSEHRFNFFDAEILQSIANGHTGNVVVSPIGIKAVLGMILEGAGGNSAEQIRTALRLPERQDAIRRLFQNYLSKIREPTSGIKLEMGSSVFMAKHLAPSHEYASSLMQYYANIVKVDFNNPEYAASTINNWIRDITRGFIPKLVDADNLHPDAQAVISNAIYFKGKWKIPFERDATKVKCFSTAPGVCQNTNMMDTLEFFKYNYIQELNADALELPYQGEKFSMLILAPKEVDGIVQLQRDLSHFPVHSIVDALETTEVLVSLPRFEIDFTTDLVPNLNSLGIQDIFGPNSNLTGMFERNENTVQVSNVFHKAKIIVNEAGSEAAAGTGALVIPLMGSTVSKFRADRPFLFFIRDTTKGITLFAGRVSVPEAASPQPQYQRPRPQTSTPSNTHNGNSDDGTYGIFTSTSKPYRPIVTRRTTPRPVLTVSSQGRPSGTSTSNNEGMQNSFSNHNNSTQENVHSSGILFSNPVQGTQQSTSQQTNTQNSFSQQEVRPSNQNFNYPQEVQNDRQFVQPSISQQIPQIIQQQQAQQGPYVQPYRPINRIHSNTPPLPLPQPQPQTQLTSQNWPTHNQNIGLQYSQPNTDRQSNIRDSGYQVVQAPRETQQYFITHNLQQQPISSQFAGNSGVYSSNNRESQQASSQQSHTGLRNDNPPQPQSYETTARQTPSRVEDQIFFQTQRNAHSSSN